jgi:hypothetical protein
MVLADPRSVEAEQEATEAWLRAGGSDKAVIVAVADAADGDEVLRRLPLLDSLLLRPITPAPTARLGGRSTSSASATRSAARTTYGRRGESSAGSTRSAWRCLPSAISTACSS